MLLRVRLKRKHLVNPAVVTTTLLLHCPALLQLLTLTSRYSPNTPSSPNQTVKHWFYFRTGAAKALNWFVKVSFVKVVCPRLRGCHEMQLPAAGWCGWCCRPGSLWRRGSADGIIRPTFLLLGQIIPPADPRPESVLGASCCPPLTVLAAPSTVCPRVP